MAGGDLLPEPFPSVEPFFIGEVPFFSKKQSYADILKQATTKYTPTIGNPGTSCYVESKISLLSKGLLKTKPLAFHLGKRSVVFQKGDKSRLIARLKYVLIAKFSHGRPPIDFVHKFLLGSNLKGKYALTVFDSKHMFIEFFTFEDFSRIWLKRRWVIQTYPVRFFKWTSEFLAKRESPIVPVWVHLPHLPLYLFEEEALLSIANAIGKPLHIDKNNLNRTKLGYASFCVELDVSKPYLDELWIEFKDEGSTTKSDGFWQRLVYDVIPLFCVGCNHVGHNVEVCKRRLSEFNSQVAVQSIEELVTANKGLENGAELSGVEGIGLDCGSNRTGESGNILNQSMANSHSSDSVTVNMEQKGLQGQKILDLHYGEKGLTGGAEAGFATGSVSAVNDRELGAGAVGGSSAGDESATGSVEESAEVEELDAPLLSPAGSGRYAGQPNHSSGKCEQVLALTAEHLQDIHVVVDVDALDEEPAADNINTSGHLQQQKASDKGLKQLDGMLVKSFVQVAVVGPIKFDDSVQAIRAMDEQFEECALNCGQHHINVPKDLDQNSYNIEQIEQLAHVEIAAKDGFVLGKNSTKSDQQDVELESDHHVKQADDTKVAAVTSGEAAAVGTGDAGNTIDGLEDDKTNLQDHSFARNAMVGLIVDGRELQENAIAAQDSMTHQFEERNKKKSAESPPSAAETVNVVYGAHVMQVELVEQLHQSGDFDVGADETVLEVATGGKMGVLPTEPESRLNKICRNSNNSSITPRKLSSAAAEFTPKWDVLVEELVQKQAPQIPRVVAKEQAVLVGKKGQEKRDHTTPHNNAMEQLKARLNRLRGDELPTAPRLAASTGVPPSMISRYGSPHLSDEMKDIICPFKCKSVPNSPPCSQKQSYSNFDSPEYSPARKATLNKYGFDNCSYLEWD